MHVKNRKPQTKHVPFWKLGYEQRFFFNKQECIRLSGRDYMNAKGEINQLPDSTEVEVEK